MGFSIIKLVTKNQGNSVFTISHFISYKNPNRPYKVGSNFTLSGQFSNSFDKMAMGFGLDHFPFRLSLLVVVCVSIMGGFVMADPAKDREECTQQLAGLATCLPYVDGEAKAPTPDCCSGLKQVLKDNKKCLCVIVRDRNDPDLGLQINATLALGLPSVCNAPANVSKCPELLHMDPKSPEAQVFYQLEKNSTGNADAPAQSPTAGGPVSTKSQGMSSGSRTQGYFSGNKGLGSDILIRGVMLWYFMGQHLLI